ncbi:hypothetical protein AB0K15_05865 [Amycolatopsis sp. NPDC049253]|uniref:hypothetical protein n=1 Tax=Amycolatopsis sp. NPDC049253 TaxID=3155274 RepID=UPI003422696E
MDGAGADLDGTWTASGESHRRAVRAAAPGLGAASGVPKLYTLVSGPAARHSTLTLSLTPGLQAYDFTFG